MLSKSEKQTRSVRHKLIAVLMVVSLIVSAQAISLAATPEHDRTMPGDIQNVGSGNSTLTRQRRRHHFRFSRIACTNHY